MNPDKTPPEWRATYIRNEGEQAQELTDVLTIFGDEGVEETFVMTFVAPLFPTSDDPAYDLDMASYSLVKTCRDRSGKTYPGLPWEPKESFRAVAKYYAAHQGER